MLAAPENAAGEQPTSLKTKIMKFTFDTFIQLFPEIQLPVSVSEESVHTFSAENDPLPEKLVMEHLLPIEPEGDDPDDLTEYIACFRLAEVKNFHAIVYWKAGLLNYQYILATFEKGGKLIDRQVIAGTLSDGSSILRSAARIDTDFTIYIVSGLTEGSEEVYDANLSTTRELELLPDGRVMELV